MRPVAIIQARMGSTRLPGKILKPLVGHPMLWHIVKRVASVKAIAEVVIATSVESRDDAIREFCAENEIACFSGSEQDVLDRFYQAATAHRGDPVLRITADCPLADPGVIARVIEMYATGAYDHVAVATGAGALYEKAGRFPDGLDAECFSMAALTRAWTEATAAADREHVTPYIWRVAGRFRLGMVRPDADYSALRWTVDNEHDLELIRHIYEGLYREGQAFDMHDVLRFLEEHPELTAVNQASIGKEGYRELWQTDSAREPNDQERRKKK
jgi:spore coat polysaccharide biosynthesis protein SpsF